MAPDRIDPVGPPARRVDPVRPPLLTPLEREQERERRERSREERRRRERERRREPPADGPPRLDVRG